MGIDSLKIKKKITFLLLATHSLAATLFTELPVAQTHTCANNL